MKTHTGMKRSKRGKMKNKYRKILGKTEVKSPFVDLAERKLPQTKPTIG